MKVIEHLDRAKNPLFSYEIIPPIRGRNASELIEIVSALEPLHPPFIDVTSHSAEAQYEELPDGTIHRKIKKKRPGTVSICGIIQNRFKIDTVAHLLCNGFTREETEDAIIELNYLGIQNVLAIHGDAVNYRKKIADDRSVNQYTSQLVKQISDLRKGQFLDEIDDADPIDFCIGVGGYPEKHFESPNLNMDLRYLKAKIDAGADYIVTQMFFDNQHFFDFEKRCREAGITVPIIPGLKILSNSKQLTSIPKYFHIDIPDTFTKEILENRQYSKTIGLEWATKQVADLLAHGVKNVHFYIMNSTKSVSQLVKTFL
jgi:methylenetetrahydrofolate reductase (NADPH)